MIMITHTSRDTKIRKESKAEMDATNDKWKSNGKPRKK